MAVNAHRVFKNYEPGTGYLAALDVATRVDRSLRSARDEIRETLRAGMRDWAKVLRVEELFIPAAADAAPASLRPKFRMQGSFAYHTCNDPAHNPPQEVDLDDGVFVPMSFWTSLGEAHPAVQSQGYFDAVEAILKPLCDHRGWVIKEKPSCVRVQISDKAHVDLALYAIPDKEFATLVEKVEASARALNVVMDSAYADSVELADSVYTALDPDHIMLAHREEGWKKSDPRKLEDWFNAAIAKHGDQVRRVSRYLKGWRDYQWSSCCLSSIALMWATVTVYDEDPNGFDSSRDDKAMLKVAARLSTLLSGPIENPVVEGARLDENWDLAQRQTFVQGARSLRASLNDAIEANSSAQVALDTLTDVFGDRIPYETKFVTIIEGAETKGVSAPSILRNRELQDDASRASVREAVKKEGDNRFG